MNRLSKSANYLAVDGLNNERPQLNNDHRIG